MSSTFSFSSHSGSARNHDTVFFAVGVAVVLAMCACIVFSGPSIIVNPHDQLDSEVIVYLLHAVHPFDAYYYEMLGGLEAANMVMASPGSVVFYLLLEPLQAFIANWVFVIVIAYISLYVCLRSFDVSAGVCMVDAILFTCIPLYSVYGLTIMGLPLMLLAIRLATEGHTAICCVLAVFYGVFSSLFLCGFAVLCVLLVWVAFLLVKGKRRAAAHIALVFGSLVVTYLVANWYALAGFAGGATQRSEFVITPEPFDWANVFSLYLNGMKGGVQTFGHSESNQYYIALLVFAATLVFAVYAVVARLRRQGIDGSVIALAKWVVGLQLLALAIAVFYCAFHSPAVVELRGHLPGALRTFQFDRIHWFYPAIWYLCLGLSAEMLLRMFGSRLLARFFVSAAIAITAGHTFAVDSATSDALVTAKSTVKGSPPPAGKVTWEGFFSEDTFKQIRVSVDPDVQSYRVASIGMHPSVALYNGFYSLDGYSNSYQLEYKHRFREIIADELECDEALKKYFDEWGNRCYVFQHEIGRNFVIGKESKAAIRDLRLNLHAFSEMGGKYLISSVPIEDYGRYGLLEVGAFESDTGVYRVHVYEIKRQ